jgi:hypothetical protein
MCAGASGVRVADPEVDEVDAAGGDLSLSRSISANRYGGSAWIRSAFLIRMDTGPPLGPGF